MIGKDRDTILVPVEVARELAFSRPYELVGDAVVYENELVDTTRWGNVSELVIEVGYAYWRATYEVGATENQDFGPFEDERDTVTFHRVVPVPKVTVEWLSPEEALKRKEWVEDSDEWS